MGELFLIAVGWLVWGIVAALIGSGKGEPGWGLFVGLLLGPIGVLLVIFSKGYRKPCSFCRELIYEEAIVCPYCQRDLKIEGR